MPRKPTAPILWRNGRAYLDARSYADVGGGKEALKPEGETRATTDPIVAQKLAAERIQELEDIRRFKHLHGVEAQGLGKYAEYHLVEKAREANVTDTWLEQAERHLEAACEFFGEERELGSVGVRDVQKYAGWLTTRKNSQGRSLGPGTRRQYLNSLSQLYRRAAGEGFVPPGYNPVQSLLHKPSAARKEARFLEVPDAALLLEAARTYQPKREDLAIPPRTLHAILATFLLTGGRYAEVMGLEVADVSFDRRTVTFRPHAHRRLKTLTSHRVVPLFPQLEEILREYLYGGASPRVTGLLFPAPDTQPEQPIRDLRKALDAVATRAGWTAGEVRTRAFRHTYTAARLQTTVGGAPISLFHVARELGHGGDALVRRIYGHLGEIPHRSEVVEYRIEQHREKLGERLAALRKA